MESGREVLSIVADVLGIVGFVLTIILLLLGKKIQDKVQDLYAANVALPNAQENLRRLLEDLRRQARDYPNAIRDIDETLSRLKGNLNQATRYLPEQDRRTAERWSGHIQDYLTRPHGKHEDAVWGIYNEGWEFLEELSVIVGKSRWII